MTLQPCPFCGFDPEWIKEALSDGHYYIRCPHCRFVMREDRRDKVIGMWNRREASSRTAEIEQEKNLWYKLCLEQTERANKLEQQLHDHRKTLGERIVELEQENKRLRYLTDDYNNLYEHRYVLIAKNTELEYQVKKLQAFKDYVHDRLDKMGIEKDPESVHKAAGCRIGGRIDIVEQQVKELREALRCAIDKYGLAMDPSDEENFEKLLIPKP